MQHHEGQNPQVKAYRKVSSWEKLESNCELEKEMLQCPEETKERKKGEGEWEREEERGRDTEGEGRGNKNELIYPDSFSAF